MKGGGAALYVQEQLECSELLSGGEHIESLWAH